MSLSDSNDVEIFVDNFDAKVLDEVAIVVGLGAAVCFGLVRMAVGKPPTVTGGLLAATIAAVVAGRLTLNTSVVSVGAVAIVDDGRETFAATDAVGRDG